jgi:hypothetical protein
MGCETGGDQDDASLSRDYKEGRDRPRSAHPRTRAHDGDGTPACGPVASITKVKTLNVSVRVFRCDTSFKLDTGIVANKTDCYIVLKTSMPRDRGRNPMMFTRGRSPYHTRYRSDDCYDQLVWEVGTPAAAMYLFTSASGA